MGTIQDAIKEALATAYRWNASDPRVKALTITKLEEALMWSDKGNQIPAPAGS